MARKRNGRGAYSIRRKARRADYYGKWDNNGRRLTPEIIAGTVLTYTPGSLR